MKKSRVAEKSMNDVKVEASKLIKEIEK